MDINEMVRDFHQTFGHLAPSSPCPLLAHERRVRVGFLTEEVVEFIGANTAVCQVDALLDVAYFAVGTAVNIGVNIPYTAMGGDGLVAYNNVIPWGSRRTIVEGFWRNMGAFLLADDMVGQLEPMLHIVHRAFGAIEGMGLRPLPLFQIVHQSNMAKLWPDGKPRWREGDGKVIKPVGWAGPKNALESEMWRQLEARCRP